MPESNVGELSVTGPLPEVSFGASVTVPPAATMMVSGFRSHSAPGTLDVPPITSNVVVYGANVWVETHDCCVEATMEFGKGCESVYDLN